MTYALHKAPSNLNIPKLLQRDLCTEWLGGHQNHTEYSRYQVYVVGPMGREIPEYFTDYVSGVREAKREALAHWKEQGLIQ